MSVENSTNFIGRLTDDVELKQTQNGVSVCSFTLAVKRPKVKDTTDFINFVAWRNEAEFLCKYAEKGDRVAVSGVLTSRRFESNGQKRTAFEVVADDIKLFAERPKEEKPEFQPIPETGDLPF